MLLHLIITVYSILLRDVPKNGPLSPEQLKPRVALASDLLMSDGQGLLCGALL